MQANYINTPCAKKRGQIYFLGSEGEWSRIRQAVQRGQLTGSVSFVDEVAQKIKRRIELRGQGRPTKKQK
jgi:hypothetical protein